MQVFDAFSYLYLVSSQRLPYMGVLNDLITNYIYWQWLTYVEVLNGFNY